jgi:hypothetical protein
MQNQADVNEVFQEHLLKGENILWSGQPDPKVIFAPADLFIVPFSVLWGGFMIFVIYSILSSMTNGNNSEPPDVFFIIIPIIFMIIGLYFIFGRFFFKKWKKQRTYYAVTNRRVLVLMKAFGQQLHEYNIKLISGINKRVRADGIGTLTFGGNQSIFYNGGQYYGNTGMDILPFYGFQLAFYDIPNANEVYKLIMDIQFKESPGTE